MKFYNQWRRYLPFFFLTLFFVSSCEKADTGTTTDKLEYDRWDQIDMSNVMYEQVKYNLAYLDPFSFVPEDKREVFEEAFNLQFEELKSLGHERALALFQERGFVSEAYAEELTQSLNTIQRSIRGGDYIDFVSVLTTIDQESKGIKNNLALTLEERKVAVSKLSVLEGVVQYFSEIYPSGTTSDNSIELRSCSFGERLFCIVEGTLTGLFLGAVATLIDNLDTATPIPPGPGQIIAIAFDGGTGLLFGGAIAGFIYGAIRGNCCEPDLECFMIEGVSLQFSDCAFAALYTAFGFGKDDVALNWRNDGGTPSEATTTTARPRLLITQEANAPFVETIITSVCSDGKVSEPFEISRNLDQLSKDVTGVFLVGPDQIYPGETYNYTGLGINSRSGAYTVRWFVNGGTVVSTTNSDALIQWNQGISNGWVQMQVYNTCTGGISKVFTINVTGDGPIP